MKMREEKLKIAICDDDMPLVSDIENIVRRYAIKRSLLIDVDVYYSGQRIIKDLKQNTYFDILFLDIEMDETDGVTVGRYIREELCNDNLLIIYISSHAQYAMDLFQVRPIDFLIKPVSEQRLFESLDVGIRLLARGLHAFSYKQGRDWNKICVQDILYFKAKDREVEMVTRNGMICFYDSLEKIYERLKMYGFFYIHKSYLINYIHVTEFYYDRLVLSNGNELKIAQGRRKAVREFQAEMLWGELTKNGY